MFAVPGWSVSSTQLTEQKQQSAAKPTSQQREDGSYPPQNGGGGAKTGNYNKRKREKGKDPMRVTKSNVDEMWKKHIEGKNTASKKHIEVEKTASKQPAEENSVLSNKKRKMEKGKNKNANLIPVTPRDGANTEDKVEADVSTPGPAAPAATDKPPKKKNKNKNKKQKGEENKKQDTEEQTTTKTNAAPAALANAPPPPPPTTSALTPLQQAMRQKLLSARFRHLNETLYTTPSERAMELFTTSPELFQEYHAGFSHQVKESWPSNPVDSYISTVNTRASVKPNVRGAESKSGPESLPRRPHGTCTIADLGCGDAQFARALMPSSKKLKLKLLSYDLCESDKVITKADITNLPVDDGSVDVTIFCLSLMGTNWVSFVEEAWRVLRGDGKGECWVSEVKSRFGKVNRKQKPAAAAGKKDKGKKKRKNPDEDEEDLGEEIFAEDARTTANDADETDISAFVEIFRTRGFVLRQESVDKTNKMFVKMEFVKTRGMPPTKGKHAIAPTTSTRTPKFGKKFLDQDNAQSGPSPEEESKVLKPCVYKIR